MHTSANFSASRRVFLKYTALTTAAFLASAGCQRQSESPSAGSVQSARLGLNLWAGFMPWKVAEEKNFFQLHQIKAEVTWFPVLSDQITAFNAGKLDMIGITMTDLLNSIRAGVKAKVVTVTDISLGADAIIASPEIKSIQDLIGKQASIEMGTVGHMLFLKALERGGVAANQVKMVNQSADVAVASLIAGKTDAVYSYEPFVSQAVNSGKGKVLFSSKDLPGIVPDLFAVQQDFLDRQPDTVQNMLKVWYQTLNYRQSHLDEVLAIEAKQAGVSVAEYKKLLEGFEWLTPQAALTALQPGNTTASMVYTAKEVSRFMVAQNLADKAAPDFGTLVDSQFVKAILKDKVNQPS
jgi:NitT/TauT family transport system substrate-binding protein